jgi:hypothetical protein
MMGLAGALGEVFDLFVPDVDLVPQEFVPAFEALDISVATGRDRLSVIGEL